MSVEYELLNFNIQDSIGQFSYKVKLSDRLDFDTKTGYLYCKDAIVGNVGVQTYKGSELGFKDGNRIVKVHRKEEYIFAEDSLESLVGKPITLNHPSEDVTSKNFRDYVRGSVLNTGREGENIICDLVIYDMDLINRIAPENEEGERRISDSFRDLSLGYSAKLLPYEDTDEFVQTDIEYNHLAVVREGRASHAIIRDSENPEIKEKKSMKLFDWLKGKKVKLNDDDTITVLDDDNPERVVAKSETVTTEEYVDPYEHDKVIKTETTVKRVVKEDDGPDAEIEEDSEKEKEGEKKNMKDKAYYVQALKDAALLPDGQIKTDLIAELNTEYLEAFPAPVKVVDSVQDSVTKGLKVVKTEEVTKTTVHDEKPEEVDFADMERESKMYYSKLTNPESKYHKSHDDWKQFYNNEVRTGKSDLNM